MECEKPNQMVRVLPDALVGAGMVLRAGQLVRAEELGMHLEPLLSSGAVEWVPVESGQVSLL